MKTSDKKIIQGFYVDAENIIISIIKRYCKQSKYIIKDCNLLTDDDIENAASEIVDEFAKRASGEYEKGYNEGLRDF